MEIMKFISALQVLSLIHTGHYDCPNYKDEKDCWRLTSYDFKVNSCHPQYNDGAHPTKLKYNKTFEYLKGTRYSSRGDASEEHWWGMAYDMCQ
jgi:hypothetical protein